MDGLAVAKAARVDLAELAPDDRYPFTIRPADRLMPRRAATIKAAMLGAGWAHCSAAERAPLLRALLQRLTDREFGAFVDAAFDARCLEEDDPTKRWAGEPWALWRTVLDQEDARRDAAERARVAAIPPTQATLDGEALRRMTEEQKVLALLRAAGAAGVSNGALGGGDTGRRYSARIEHLRKQGYVIETTRLGPREFNFRLVSEPATEAA